MASKTEICNLAISHLGISKEIANVDTEKSQEAYACKRFFDICRDTTLRDFPWPFATRFIAVGLVEEDPTSEWAFSYRYPSDCLVIRRLLSNQRIDTQQSRIPYKVGSDASGRLIYTDLEDAEIEYTVLIDDPNLYPDDFVLALSYRIAMQVAARITGGDPFKVGDKAALMYQLELTRAQAASANEEFLGLQPESEFTRARD